MLQRIERRWAQEWKKYKCVTPKYAKKFAIKPPCIRPPLGDQQSAHPSSMVTIEDYPEEKAKYWAKLKKTAKEAMTTFNEESAAASSFTAEASATEQPPKKALLKKSGEIKTLTEKFTSLHADRKGVKVRIVKAATKAIIEYNNKVADPMQPSIPQASYTIHLADEDDEPGANARADDEPVADATTDESARPATEYAMPEENVPSPKSSTVKKVTLTSHHK
ncbi:hypothetical protein ZWY2020_040030 [Hordeum vulgare]|nr:hypothetical protein ZWY2020_040030 [Hordeum vulgare]